MNIDKDLMQSFLQPQLLLDKLFVQAWEGSSGATDSYFGRIKDIDTKRKTHSLIISYWLAEKETEDQCEDFVIPLEQLIHDIIAKEVVLVEP